jgi:hypothetical protein
VKFAAMGADIKISTASKEVKQKTQNDVFVRRIRV